MGKEVYIVSAVRTPIGSFMGSLSALSATKLGAIAIKAALEKANVEASNIDEVFMGNVLSANVGQAPARQAAIFAGISENTPCTTVNKVCASGMKSLSLAAQTILLGDNDIVVAGGMESMSNVPFYSPNMRKGVKLGNVSMIDGLVNDGLWDVYNNYHMGNAGELCAKEYNISREAQDEYAIESYKRAQNAIESGKFNEEVVPVEIPQRKGDPIVVDKDEEPYRVKFEKIPSLRPVFQKEGTVTAANASTINDGAAALVLASKEAVEKYGLKPIAKIVSYADAALAPEWFTMAPSEAMPKALKKAGLSIADIDAFEVNEAFSVVSIANQQKLEIDNAKLNVYGGAVSIGHPLGCSGARIITTLISVLRNEGGKYGLAGICNGGGGASAMLIEKL